MQQEYQSEHQLQPELSEADRRRVVVNNAAFLAEQVIARQLGHTNQPETLRPASSLQQELQHTDVLHQQRLVDSQRRIAIAEQSKEANTFVASARANVDACFAKQAAQAALAEQQRAAMDRAFSPAPSLRGQYLTKVEDLDVAA